jgi:hypothetical protein
MARSMRRPPRTTLLPAVVAALACLLAAPSLALGESALEQYQRTGQIDPCTATNPGDIPNDVEQYAPDFRDALNDAARRGCDRGVSTTRPTETKAGIPVAAGGALPPGTKYVPKPPAPVKPFHDDKAVSHLPLASGADVDTPAPVLVLGVMLLVLLAGTGVAAAARRLGWGTDRLDPLRHAFGELGLRLRDLTRRGV